ncbi:hypothetical protein Tco_1447871 [Tanacetum coccineum]
MIEEINYNPPPSSDLLIKSSSTSLNLFLEETNTFDNSLTESEIFCFDLEENSSGNTTTRSDYSLSVMMLSIDDDLTEEKSRWPGVTLFHEEFADEIAHILSPPEYDCFYLRVSPIWDDQSPLLAYVVWILLPVLTYPVDPPYLLSTEWKIPFLTPGISFIISFYAECIHRSGILDEIQCLSKPLE